jgi:hypothetical protein
VLVPKVVEGLLGGFRGVQGPFAGPLWMAGLVLLGLGLRRVAAVPHWITLVMIGAAVGTVPVMFFVLLTAR